MSIRKFGNYDLEGMPPVLAWNPIAMRCTPVDEGCRNCWHLRMCDRMEKNQTIQKWKRTAYAGDRPVMPELPYNFSFPKNPRVIATEKKREWK